MATDSSDSDSEVEPPLPIRLYSTKPRSLVQRRATITGASPTTKHGIDIEQFWKELKQEHCTTFQLRDKAASCAHGLDNVPSSIRPQTCLGIEAVKRRKKTDGQLDDKKVQFQEKSADPGGSSSGGGAVVHPDDAKRGRVAPAGSCESGGAASSVAASSRDANKEQHSRAADNVSDSNNLSDTSVPLDECNNFISDTRSISSSRSSPAGKEITGVRHAKERGKLDKSYSTPAYDLSDPEDKEDRKLTLFEGPFCKFDLPAHPRSSNSAPASVPPRTDAHAFTESADDHRGGSSKDAPSRDHKEPAANKRCGNVARKVSDIEKQIAQIESAVEQACVLAVPKESESRAKNPVRVAANDASPRASVGERNQSDIGCDASGISDKYGNVDDLNTECETAVCSRKSSPCDRREDNCSHSSELSCSGGSADGDATSRRLRDPESQVSSRTSDGASVQHTRPIERKSSTTVGPRTSGGNVSLAEDDMTNVTHSVTRVQISAKPQTKDAKCTSDSSMAATTVQSCRYIELPKVESVRKYENRHHATPPEPPPRYYTKQMTDARPTNNAPRVPEDSEKPQVPERPGVRRELKKADLSSPWNHVRSNSDCQDRQQDSSPDVYAFNPAENSFDFIDEPRAMIGLNDQRFTQSDASLYSENQDRQLREDKYAYEKYEPFADSKFACCGQSATDGYKSDYSSRHVEYSDNAMSFRQMMPLHLRPKLSEKDRSFEKSVVNRAMMVARSIGLHGSLSKSNSSPRSSRKRNMLLASKY